MVKDQVRRLLEGRQYDGLLQLAKEDPEVVTHVVAFLDNREGLLRWRAIEGLGHVVAGLSRKDENFGREIIRRLGADNPASGESGWSVPEAVGEIIKHQPERYADLVAHFVDLPYRDEGLRRGVIWALGRIGKRNPALVAGGMPVLLRALGDPNPEIRGLAAWSLGEIGVQEAASALGDLRGDHQAVTIYEAGKLWQRTVGEVALDALANIRARA